MTWLVEQPLMILFAGIVIEAILLVMLLQSGRRAVLYAILAVALVVGGLLFLERQVVTDTEAIRATIHEIARDLQSNNLSAVLRHVSSTSPELREDATQRLKLVVLERVKITTIRQITVHPRANPPLAEAEFSVLVIGGDRLKQVTDQRVPLSFLVELCKEAGHWRVSGYEMRQRREGL